MNKNKINAKNKKWMQALEDLHSIAQNFGIEVIYDKIYGEGGYCKIHNKPMIILNRIYSSQAHVKIFLKNLNIHFPLEDIYLSPLLRDLLSKNYFYKAG